MKNFIEIEVREVEFMIRIENAYIFNIGVNENNMKIVNNISFIENNLADIPIINERDEAIGIVEKVTEIKGNKIYGNIMFWDNKYKDYKYFKNYEVEVDYNCKYKENIDGIVEVLINKILGIFLTNTPIQNK